ncbi:hypothetical protein M9H77_21530 [Catharanthus roseus]|uniref:Uncharacterized protein n=1 Tax=Catharanthus roseus TaxID=4058 RepID=A0ACC0AQD8_CATRO|nr:hypothetical protein M9H77_21530 [Catharanthus roseus]
MVFDTDGPRVSLTVTPKKEKDPCEKRSKKVIIYPLHWDGRLQRRRRLGRGMDLNEEKRSGVGQSIFEMEHGAINIKGLLISYKYQAVDEHLRTIFLALKEHIVNLSLSYKNKKKNSLELHFIDHLSKEEQMKLVEALNKVVSFFYQASLVTLSHLYSFILIYDQRFCEKPSG